jgi:SnoaL-like domain
LTPLELWNRYAAIWSADADTRAIELRACLADDATYCDPNGPIEGRDALSTYMGTFQQSAPRTRFQIEALQHHHGQTLATWTLRNPSGDVLQNGTSFAPLSADGRLAHITGFFHP